MGLDVKKGVYMRTWLVTLFVEKVKGNEWWPMRREFLIEQKTLPTPSSKRLGLRKGEVIVDFWFEDVTEKGLNEDPI